VFVSALWRGGSSAVRGNLMMPFDTFFVIAVAVIAALAALLSPRLLLPLLLTLGSLNIFSVYWRFSWSPSKVILVLSSLAFLRLRSFSPLIKRSLPWQYIFAMLLSVLINYMWVSNLEVPWTGVGDICDANVAARTWTNFGVEILYFMAIVPFAYRNGNVEDLNRILRLYVWFSTLLCIYGMYQYFAYYLHLPVRKIIRPNGAAQFPVFPIGDVMICRMYSLCGEPKSFASFILPSFIALIIPVGLRPAQLGGTLFKKWNLVLHFLCLVLAFSTSIFVSLFFVLMLVFLILGQKKTFRYLLVTCGLLFILFIANLVTATYFGGGFLRQVFAERTVNRLDAATQTDVSAVDTSEGRALVMYAKSPGQWLLGFGKGNYSYALYNYYKVAVPYANPGFVDVLIETGFVGLAALLWYLYRIYKRLKDVSCHEKSFESRKTDNMVLILFVSSAINYLMFEDVAQFIVFISLAVSRLEAFKILSLNKKIN